MAYYTYVLSSCIDFLSGSLDYDGLPEVLKRDADQLVELLDQNPLGDTDWRDAPRFGFVPMPYSDIRLWELRKLESNGTCVIVSPLPLGYPQEMLWGDVKVDDPLSFKSRMMESQLRLCLKEARSHVSRQQFAGKHEQDRLDATEWLKKWGQ
jgi:hypothetical protein